MRGPVGTTVRFPNRRGDDDQPPDGETKKERLDREHDELFNELRSIIPGVQIQGAFLLTIAFTQRFERLNAFQRDVYYITFLLAAASLVLLFAPAAFHRVQFRQFDKEMLLRAATVEMILALVLVSFSLAGTVLLISDLIVPTSVAIAAALAVLVATGLLWWAFPLARRLTRR